MIRTGLAYTPDEYRAMTRSQRNAIVSEANRRKR